jgi:alpha-ketoglutarate-dependent taurine dioxygenase
MTQTFNHQSGTTSTTQWTLTETRPFGLLIEAKVKGLSPSNLPVAWLKELVDEHLFIVLRGFTNFPSKDDFGRYSETWGPLLEWNFGTVLDVKEDPSTIDTVFDTSCIPLHWDAMFNPICPKYIIFEGVCSPGKEDGGRTTFCNTALALARASKAQIERWRRTTVTYSVERLAHYGGTTTSPIVTPHPEDPEREVIRFGEPEDAGVQLKNPVHRSYDAPDYADPERLVAELKEILTDPSCFYAHPWQNGDYIISDNYTILHGREPFRQHSYRHLRRTQILATPPHRNQWKP